MKLMGKVTLAIVGFAAYLGVGAASASAQQGSFKLPVEAHVGRVALAPGDYKVKFPSADDTFRVIRLTGNGKTMSFLPVETSYNPRLEIGRLTLSTVNGSYSFESITDVSGHRAYTFWMPKNNESDTGSLNHRNGVKIAVEIKKASN